MSHPLDGAVATEEVREEEFQEVLCPECGASQALVCERPPLDERVLCHSRADYTCLRCALRFRRDWRAGLAWYTTADTRAGWRVLKGRAVCCGLYRYPCATPGCTGTVLATYRGYTHIYCTRGCKHPGTKVIA